MAYRHLFDPQAPVSGTPATDARLEPERYVFDDDTLVLAVNVALATHRPLLVRGEPGSGKSTLAPNVARILGRPFHEEIVTARTEPDDLLWRFDAVARLSDAQQGEAAPARSYYREGVLWKAFVSGGTPAVALIDEIDKADPDVPNSLLGPLANYGFTLPDERVVAAEPGNEPLIVITSNDERRLPQPFLRRCVSVVLESPTRDHLLRVARAHLGDRYDPALGAGVADVVLSMRGPGTQGENRVPSTAEFLDTLWACHELGIDTSSPEWRELADVSLLKVAGPRS